MIGLCALTFVAGMFVDGTAVFWVHYSERGKSLQTALFAAMQATAQVVGIGESVHDWRTGPFFVAGYALGAGLAVALKTRFSGHSPLE